MDGTYVKIEKPKVKLEPLKKNPEKKVKTEQSSQKNIVQSNKQANKVFFILTLFIYILF